MSAATDEGWQHAACLSIAEGAPEWEEAANRDDASPAMRAVAKLRRDYLRMQSACAAACSDIEFGWTEDGVERLREALGRGSPADDAGDAGVRQ